MKEDITFEQRREFLQSVAPGLFQPCFGMKRIKITEEVNQNLNKYYEMVYECAGKLYEKLRKIQMEEGKGPLAYISIFYLKSSIYTGTNQLMIQALTDELYFDPVEVSVDFSIEFIMQYLEDDMKFGERYIKSKIPNVESVLIKEIKHEYAGNYLMIAEKFMEYFSYVFAEHSLLNTVMREDKVQVTFSGFGDKGRVLYEI